MADSTIDSELIVLINPFPVGAPTRTAPADIQDLANSYSHNVAAQTEYRVGDVINFYNTGVSAGKAGWSQFVYLQCVANAGVAIAAKQVLVPDSATIWYRLTNDPDDCLVSTGSRLFGVAISAMTTLYYGWFWCGGVCPEEAVSDLGGNHATDGDLAAGNMTVHDLAADAIGWGPQATTEAFCGYSLATDA